VLPFEGVSAVTVVDAANLSHHLLLRGTYVVTRGDNGTYGKLKRLLALRGFVGLLPDGLDVNVQAERAKGAQAA